MGFKDIVDKDGNIVLTKEEIEAMPWSGYLAPADTLKKVEPKLRIVAKDFSMATRSYDIFFSGCKANPKCTDCHNPEAWDFSCGTDWKQHILKINKDVLAFGNVIDKFFILGGEPLDQDLDELEIFLEAIKEYGKEIWLFTRFDIKEVPDRIKKYCDYIKCGAYIPSLSTSDNVQYGVKLATSNQYIVKVN